MGSGEFRQYLVCFLCQFSVVIAGSAYSWFAPNVVKLTQDPELNMTSSDISWLISSSEFGCFLGPLIAGDLIDKVGRKYLVMSVGPLSIAGWVMILSIKSLPFLITARVLHGLAKGMAYTVAPLYVSEIAEPTLRGKLAGTFQVAWYSGVLFSFACGQFLSINTFIFASLPLPIIFLCIVPFLQETPYFYLITYRTEDARDALTWIRDSSEVSGEMSAMQKDVREENSQFYPWKAIKNNLSLKKSFNILQIMSTAVSLTGTPVIVNYVFETFSKSESFLPPEDMALILCGVLVVSSVISWYISHRICRKAIIVLSCFGCFVANLLTGAYYFIHEATTYDASIYIWLLYIGLPSYCFFTTIGLSPLMQIIHWEMFGPGTRFMAAGITQVVSAMMTFVALKAYSPLNEMFGTYSNFWIYSGVSLVCGVLLFYSIFVNNHKLDLTTDRPSSITTTEF